MRVLTTENTDTRRINVALSLCVLFGSLFVLSGCASITPPRGARARTITMETTGYCSCGDCCGWKRSLLPPFRPVYKSGSLKGKRKKVGVTSTGTKARKGTIAADTEYYDFGIVMYVSGYGYGRVEDRGSSIKGRSRLDLFFKTHDEALRWGRRRVSVKVWR